MFFRSMTAICLALLFFAVGRSALAGGYGTATVHLISDGSSEGSSQLFVGADDALVKKYLPGGTYPTAINYFVVFRPDGKVALVDTGFGKKLVSGLDALGLKLDDIDAVLLTHMHGDHIGGLLTDGRPTFPRAQIHVAERERAYWTDPAAMEKASRKEGFVNAQKALAAYGDRVRTFQPGELETRGIELLPGIRAIAAYGHTPGHTMFLVDDKDAPMLIWGDLTHAMAMQMPAPQTAMVYDVDPKEAVATRLKVLDYVSERKLPVAGMHIPATGMGFVVKGREGYDFIASDLEGVLGHRENALSKAPPRK